jgi:hypothetical protein
MRHGSAPDRAACADSLRRCPAFEPPRPPVATSSWLPEHGAACGSPTERLAPGVEVRELTEPASWPELFRPTTRLVFVETPSNPGLDVCDIGAAATAAHAAGALLAVDNTTATPLGQRPLALGADLTVASDTKALSGHGDVLLGHVTAADPALAQRLREARTQRRRPRPDGGLAAHRGLGTLDLRLARQGRQRRRAGSGPARSTPPSATCGGRAA